MAGKVNPKTVVKEYLKNIPDNIKIDGVFLFGSYATGKARKNSDLDLIVLSPNFKNISFIKRLEMLSKFRKSKATRLTPMDIIGYTSEEFKKIGEESLVLQKAKKEGKMIYGTGKNI